MEHYIDKLCEALHGLTDKPVTLGRAQEACVYADAICAMERLHGREDAPETFSRETAIRTAPARRKSFARITGAL